MVTTSGNVVFRDDKELVNFAKVFLKKRLKSLKYDVNRCLKKDKNKFYSPFPALMYCLAVIDLLGALNAGQAEKKIRRKGKMISVNTVSNSKKYATRYLKYEKIQIDTVWDFIRHKIVHLAMPETAIKYRNSIVSWDFDNNDDKYHLKVKWKKMSIPIGNNNGEINVKGKFVINIRILQKDITKSINDSTNGYLVNLQKKPFLRKKFKKAIKSIYRVK